MKRRSLLVGLALLAACAQTPPPVTGDLVHLSGTEWRRIDDENANPHGATLNFEGARASGYTGCNQWSATVTQNGEVLRFGAIGTTRRGCDGAGVQVATERSFVAVLEATRYAHYDRDALVLLDAQQSVIARFDRENP
jgi:heat shock protein HslJ